MNFDEEFNKIFCSTYQDNVPNDKPILLYGAGSLGEMAFDLLSRKKIKIVGFVDKNKSGKLRDLKIFSISDIPNNFKKDYLCLVCIATLPYNSILSFLQENGFCNIKHFYEYANDILPELNSNGWNLYKYSKDDIHSIKNIFDSLGNDYSKAHYLQFLWWKIRNIEKIYPDYPVLTGRKFFKCPIFPKLGENEVLIDCGCHYGQTIQKFIDITNNKYKDIYAFEPDPENLSVCTKNFDDERIHYSSMAIDNENKVKFFNSKLGFASSLNKSGNLLVHTIKIDELKLKPTIIKFHTEGFELQGLQGSISTINNNRPILMVMADHNSDGLYKIPEFLNNLKDYVNFFYLNDYCGNTAVYYAIPSEKMK